MGINDHDSPSLLLNRTLTVPDYTIPRVLSDLQKERKDSEGRTRYLRRLSDEKDMSWSAQRRREFEEMKKRRSEEGAAS
ncbi:hypothetical protein GTC6_05407 [Gordonia terrae C-6]|uniref:Uncharacterized protein n=1 Tax=Gordonia terrae C-6 TaxID=1316928 RepID=R7YCQ4_9ACTN|nr:hypothetical protein [Gordonia terrae]EON33778.1 hypothetical protein GTC6_05407 [Gordonia terrae C-6]